MVIRLKGESRLEFGADWYIWGCELFSLLLTCLGSWNGFSLFCHANAKAMYIINWLI
jgi:hypothetical protein